MEYKKNLTIFEKYLTMWVLLCVGAEILPEKVAPTVATTLDSFSVYQVSIPIAICLFFMMYLIMVKIDFKEVIMAGKTPKPVLITLGIDWAIKSFTMYLIAGFFLGVVFRELLSGTEIVKGGDTVELWRSYVSGAILLGVTPCTAMVLMWGYLVKGNDRSGKTFERRHHMTIQILGTGCPRCKKLEENARKAVNELAISCKIEKVTDLNEIMEYGIIMTPGLAIDKKVKSVGKVLTPEQIKAFITGRGR